MSATVDLPEGFPKNLELQQIERILEGFGYELTMRPISKRPEPKAPLGFGFAAETSTNGAGQ